MSTELIAIIIVILAAVFVSILVYLSKDNLQPYVASLGLQKAALVFSGNLEELKQTILPVRHSAFSYVEPTIWLCKDSATGAEILMTADPKKDVRLWFQPPTVLNGVHIVLDSAQNNRVVSNLMHLRLPEQRIDLEGDFPQHFRLFCNPGQQDVALQIIAPDIMAFLLDKAMDVDIEIIDNQVGVIVRGAAKSQQQLQDAVDVMLHMHQLVTAVTKVTSL